jgi:YD repeat-containing protein
MAYDEFNRLVTVVDDPTGPIGSMTTLDPRCTRSDGLNLVTRYEYDANDNRTHQYDPGDIHVEFTYDALNRKTAHIQHKQSGSLVTRYTAYDEEGNLEEIVDAKDQTFTYAYDELDRQTDQFFPNETTPYLAITHIQTEYDANNNVVRITENKKMPDDSVVADITANNYDDFDRLGDSTQRGLTIDYEYDANGNRTLVATAAGTTAYTYDSRNPAWQPPLLVQI